MRRVFRLLRARLLRVPPQHRRVVLVAEPPFEEILQHFLMDLTQRGLRIQPAGRFENQVHVLEMLPEPALAV